MPVPTSEQIAAYESTPTRVREAIGGLSNEQLLLRPTPEEWSIAEIILHLPDSENFGYERLRRTIAEEKPALQAYPESIWAERLGYRQQDRRLALDLFEAQRRASTALIKQLPEEAWVRTGIHSERGEMTLHEVFLTYLNHGEDHLYQIEQIKKQL